MMSVKNWLLLLLIYTVYLLLGGLLFTTTECPYELAGKQEEFQRDADVEVAINHMRQLMENNTDDLAILEQILDHWVDREVMNGTSKEDIKCSKWNFQNSLFFSFTVVTTIGYGHQATETPHGRMLCLLYALIGVPLNAILIGALGSVFSNEMKRLKKRMWYSFGEEDDGRSRPKSFVVVAEGLVFVVFFCAIFIFLPAAAFHYIEDDDNDHWSYLDSVYYAFITLSTIGFGDMVPDRQENYHIHSDAGKMAYLVGIIIWIIFGMGFIFGMVDVISGTLKATSKPVKKAFQGLKNQLNVNDYWRKIIGEIIVLKGGAGGTDLGEAGEGVSILGLGVGGGSEPCLGEMEGVDNPELRRVRSTGDLEIDPTMQESEYDHPGKGAPPHMSRTASLQNPMFLTVPGGGLPTTMVTSVSDHELELEAMNEDTITSLRQFLTRAEVNNNPAWAENNIPGYGAMVEMVSGSLSTAPTRPVSRSTSLRQTTNHYLTVTGAEEGVSRSNTTGQADFQQRRRRSLQPSKLHRKNSMHSNFSRQSATSSTGTAGPLGQLLEQTTLGEFLTAVENVRKKSRVELVEKQQEESRATNSLIRRLSQMHRKTSREGLALPTGTFPQLNSLFSLGTKDEAVNNSDIPLITDGGSPCATLTPSSDQSRQTLDHEAIYTQHM